MGLFSGVKKAVSSVVSSAKDITKSVFSSAKDLATGNFGGLMDTAKDVAGSSWGKAGLDILGAKLGVPGLGGMLGNILGSDNPLAAGIGELGSYYSAKSLQEAEQRSQERNFDKYYDLQLEGIRAQNTTAREIAREANAMSQANAREQMGFQEHLGAMAHQREVLDLRAAGLNPILSGTGGMGASTPAGASGSVYQAPVRSEGDAVSSAMDVFRTMAQAVNTQAETAFLQGAKTTLTGAQTEQTRAATAQLWSQATLNKVTAVLRTNEIDQVQQSVRNLATLNGLYASQTYLTQAQRSKVAQETKNLVEVFKGLHMRGEIDASEFGKLTEMAKRVSDVAGLSELVKAMDWVKRLKKP